MIMNHTENDILRDKSREYLNECMKTEDYGSCGGNDEVRDAFADGCSFTIETAQKIVEEMFSSFLLGDTGKNLAVDFRNKLFDTIKEKPITL